jgi:solute carrier family 25 (mitochondrial aspartate/glutamate transporter), member 12/13
MASCMSMKLNDFPSPLHFHLAPMAEKLPTASHFLAAGTASAVASGTFNPLDCLRVRWQTQLCAKEQSILAFGRRIVQQEGLWQGLWKPAVGVNMIGMATASGLRFGYYETIRNGLRHGADTGARSNHEKQAWHMIVAGLISGGTAYFITTPFHLLKTRIQSEAGGHRQSATLWEGVVQIVSRTGNLSSLFKGSGPLAVRGSLFTAGQMVGTFQPDHVQFCMTLSSTTHT